MKSAANTARIVMQSWAPGARQLLVITLGMLIYTIGFTVFILPHGVVIGGMAGFSTLVFYATAEKVPVAVTMYGVNILLLLLGARELGRGFVGRTIFGATVLSVMIGATEGYFTSHAPLVTDITLSVTLGAVLLGVGIGLYYSHNGTAGGTDIVAALMAKKYNISVGRVMMIVDMSIVACSFFLPFDGSLEERVQVRTQTILYGWLSIFLYSYITDVFLKAGRQTVQLLIISTRWHEVGSRIAKETGRGVTTWSGEGFWTGESRKLMLVWCRKPQLAHMMEIIRDEDPHAYVTDTYVRSVYGNGFDAIPSKKSHSQKADK